MHKICSHAQLIFVQVRSQKEGELCSKNPKVLQIFSHFYTPHKNSGYVTSIRFCNIFFRLFQSITCLQWNKTHFQIKTFLKKTLRWCIIHNFESFCCWVFVFSKRNWVEKWSGKMRVLPFRCQAFNYIFHHNDAPLITQWWWERLNIRCFTSEKYVSVFLCEGKTLKRGNENTHYSNWSN